MHRILTEVHDPTVTDEVIDLHDRIVGKLFNTAKHKHQEQFQADGRAINDKLQLYRRVGQALLEAKQSGSDPFAAIETIVYWAEFAESVTEAQKFAQPEDLGFEVQWNEKPGSGNTLEALDMTVEANTAFRTLFI